MLRLRLCLIAVVALIIIPVAAMAYQLDLYGISARSIALANAYSILSDGPEACYYNPGSLIESRSVRGLVGYSFATPAFTVEQRDNQSRALTASETVKEAKLVNTGQWLNLGVSAGIKNRVFLGVLMQMPIDGAERRKWFSPDQPYYLNYDTGQFGWTIVPAIGVQVAPNVGIGLAAHAIIDGSGDIQTGIPLSGGDAAASAKSKTYNKMDGQFAPIFGVYARPLEYLRVGATYRGQSYHYLHKNFSQVIDQETGAWADIEYEVKYNFKPRTFVLAVSGDPAEFITVIGQLSWENWTGYEPPFPQMAITYHNMDNPPNAKAMPIPDQNFTDCIIPAIGVEGRPSKHMNLDIGYSFRTNPVPMQTGTTNILNTPTHVLGLGLGAKFLGKSGDLLHVNMGFQVHIMRSQDIGKYTSEMVESDPTKNPLFPRYYTSGAVLVSGMSVSMKF